MVQCEVEICEHSLSLNNGLFASMQATPLAVLKHKLFGIDGSVAKNHSPGFASAIFLLICRMLSKW